jgi:hypothetical protein
LAYTHAASDDEQTQLVSLGGKTQLIPLQDARTGVSLGYGVNAAKVAGARWSHELATVYLIATREIAPGLLVHANLGTAHSRSARQQSTTWAAAFEWSAWPRVVWSGETYGDDRSPPWIGTGLWWGAGANFSLNVSLGVQRSEPRTRQVTAGFNIEF